MRPVHLPAPPETPAPTTGRRPWLGAPDSARVHLLEFVWPTRLGVQPVLFVVRTYLH